jgi:hypothetical protein
MFLKKRHYKYQSKLTGETKTYAYYYLVKSYRNKGKVKQKDLCCLGKEPIITLEKAKEKGFDLEKLTKIKGLKLILPLPLIKKN